MKKLWILAICLFCIVGCSSQTEVPAEPEPPTNPQVELKANEGEVVSLTLDEAIEKKNNNESFVLILTQTYCNYCLNFFMETDAYTKEIGLTLWDVTLDDEARSETQNLSLIKRNFGEFASTPSLYFISDGKVQGQLLASETKIDLETYQNWLKELGIIK